MNTNSMVVREIVLAIYSRLDQAFPNREEITQKEAAQYLGISVVTARRYLPFTIDGKISKAMIAKHLMKER